MTSWPNGFILVCSSFDWEITEVLIKRFKSRRSLSSPCPIFTQVVWNWVPAGMVRRSLWQCDRVYNVLTQIGCTLMHTGDTWVLFVSLFPTADKFRVNPITELHFKYYHQWRIQDFPLGGRRPVGGGANLWHIHFSVKTYAKTKEIDPVGGARAAAPPWIRQWLPRSEIIYKLYNLLSQLQCNPALYL